jgi:hypothetical protein
MDQRQVEDALDRHMTRLRALALAFCFSVGFYVLIGWILIALVGFEALAGLPFALVASVAVLQLLVILAGYLVSLRMRVPRGDFDGSAAHIEEALQRYLSSVVVASALREVAAVVGFVLTLLTGNLVWVIGLGAVATISMMVHWPRREAVRDFLQQQRATR